MPFRDIAGHRRIIALLSRAIERGSLPPTLLFAGSPGIGKWKTAIATAATVNCLEPSHQPGAELPIDACGTCRSCDRIARGMHVDVITIEPDDRASIKIDVVRDVLTRTPYRPFEGKRRVVLIREADTLEAASQNALLKSLEEPPPGTTFILTTAVPGALLPTVRSRCMRLGFGRLTVSEVADSLVRDHGRTDTQARALAPLADGSLGQALAMSDAEMMAQRDLAVRFLQQASGRVDAQTRLQAAALVVGPPKNERSREDLAVVLRMTASMLRDIEALNAGADRRVLANPLIAEDLSGLARAFAGDRARVAFGAVDRALAALERNAGTKVVAEWLAVHL